MYAEFFTVWTLGLRQTLMTTSALEVIVIQWGEKYKGLSVGVAELTWLKLDLNIN